MTATDTANGSLTASQALTISPAPAASLVLSGPGNAIAGTAQTMLVALYDAYGNVASGYTGAVHFTSTDAQAVLPSDYTFTNGDTGMHQFSVVLKTSGSQALNVSDTANGSLNTSQTIQITPAPAASLRERCAACNWNSSCSTLPRDGGPLQVTATSWEFTDGTY